MMELKADMAPTIETELLEINLPGPTFARAGAGGPQPAQESARYLQ